MSAVDEKDLGAKAWKEEKFDIAVKHWSKAIELVGTSDKEMLKTLHSNRSAAYTKLFSEFRPHYRLIK
jgi:hypothetical protein